MAGRVPKTVADDVEAPEPEPTLRETIEAARDEIKAREQPQETDGGQGEQAEARSAAPAPVVSKEAPVQPSRGASNRAGSEAQGQRAAGTRERSSAGPGTGQPAPVALPPPQGWKPEEKALWSSIPAAAQHAIARREQESHRKITEQDEVRSVGTEFMRVANQYAPVIQARGGDPVRLVNELLGYVAQIHNSPPAARAALFAQLAANNGVDMRAFAGGQPQQSGAQPNQGPSPQQPQVPIHALIEQGVEKALSARQAQDQKAREQAEMQQAQSEIDVFRSKADASGQPLYPYLQDYHPYMPYMTTLMGSIIAASLEPGWEGQPVTLEEAYNLAVRAHPEASKALAAAEQAAARAAEEKQRRADAKRRAAGSVNGSMGGSAQVPGDRSLREELTANFREVVGRV